MSNTKTNSNVRDLTSGSPLKLIIALCVPMILGNIMQQFYNMVDAIIVRKYINIDAYSAVGSTGSICFLVIGFAMGICNGFCIMISQSYGASDFSKMRKYIMNSIYLATIISAILTVVTLIFTRPLLILMKTPEDILDYSESYLITIFAGITVTIFYNLLSAILRALGNSTAPLVFLIIASVINIILDILFISQFNMGIMGAGLATIIAQGISAILCFIYIKRCISILKFEKDEMKINASDCKKLLSIGLPMALQFSITAIGSIVLQTAINSLGTVYIAAVTTAQKIQMIAFGPMECIGLTLATFCGQNRGARKYDRITLGLKQGFILSISYCIIAAILINLFGQSISTIFVGTDVQSSNISEIIKHTRYFLKFSTICFPAISVLFIIRSSLQGIGYSLLPMMAGFTELVARIIVAKIIVAKIGYIGVCLAGPIAWIAADILLIITAIIKFPKLKKELS